jgi:hypothetical protein
MPSRDTMRPISAASIGTTKNTMRLMLPPVSVRAGVDHPHTPILGRPAQQPHRPLGEIDLDIPHSDARTRQRNRRSPPTDTRRK